MKLFVFFILSFVVLTSCSHENIGKYAENVYFVGESEDNIHVDDYSISLNVTPLDTSAFSFDPKKGLIARNNLYVMDSRGIFKLDIENGSLLAFYDKKGHGHNEYLRLINFDIDTINGKIYLLCEPTKIIELTLDFQTIGEMAFDGEYDDLAFFDGRLYLYSYYMCKLDVVQNGKPVTIMDLPNTRAWVLSRCQSLHKSTNELLFTPQPFSSVFSINGDSARQIVHLSYPDEERIIDRMYSFRTLERDDILTHAFPKITGVAANDDLMIIKYTFGFAVRVCLIDRVNSKIITDGFMDFPQFPNSTYNGELYSITQLLRYSGFPSLDSLKAEVNYTLPEDKNNEQLALVKYYFRPDLIAK